MGDGIIVFAGPTLPREPGPDWRALLDACRVLPPARRGDVLSALAFHPRTIVLLDGYYFTVPSVTHKELLYALDAGVRVIGAASLGALRAAELAPFGMEGVGAVFDGYKSGALEGDDEVALLHAPAEHGYRPITLALVEVRHALARLAVDAAAAEALIADLKNLSFLDRDPARVADLARKHLGDASDLTRFLGQESVKREDARKALERALETAPAADRRARPASGYIGYYKETALRVPEGPTLQRAWRMAQLFHPAASAFARRVRRRALLVSAALHAGLAPDGEEEIKEGLRRLHPFLPEPEYREEARFEALAEKAIQELGGSEGALAFLAETLGLDRETGEDSLLHLLTGRADSLPSWWFVRAFSFTPAFPAAVDAARAAGEVHRCFLRWADGSRASIEDLRSLAARLWNCEPERVDDEAARRALFPAADLAEGLRESLELVIAAERLPRPINDWPEKRDALKDLPLSKSFL
ncbi:MAG TPA: TfuA-like protein [Thermoanaerobaculia bacterium]|nr:TfuA-like protein [Thermoanaerobaculia bacterium]